MNLRRSENWVAFILPTRLLNESIFEIEAKPVFPICKSISLVASLPLDLLELLLGGVDLDDLEELGLVLWAEDAARDLAEELLQHGRDRVHAEAVDVHQPALE